MISPPARQRISDFQEHVNTIASELRNLAQAAWDGMDFSRSEPEIVYEFLAGRTSGTGHLNREVAPLLSVNGRIVKFASIFLHQKPLVFGFTTKPPASRTGAAACELGDLQVLFVYADAAKGVCQCRSTVFQTKKVPEGGDFVLSNAYQRRLYDQAHCFEYKTVLPGTTRFLPRVWADRERALQYLFVGAQPVRARLIPADVGAGAFLDFGEFLVRLLNDSTGLAVAAPPTPGLKDWTRIVWDMIEQVAQATANERKTRDSGLYGLLQHFNSFEDRKDFFLEGPPHRDSPVAVTAGGGIPILLVIVSDKELTKERGKALPHPTTHK
jgi:hypothetical protein